jgi:hypothetical protein
MSDTLSKVQALVAEGKARVSDHGYDELADDDILAIDVLVGADAAVVIEDYPQLARDRAFWFFRRMPRADLYTYCGAFRKGIPNLPWW